MDYIRRHHVGLIALFLALGGTSYAATQLPAGSVGTSQIRNGAVTASKLSPAVNRQLQRKSSGSKPAGPEPAWRDPGMEEAIAAAGQRIVSKTVVTVPANAPWVQTGVSIQAGQRLWIDTRSDGRWSGNPRYFPYSDANGLSIYPGQYKIDSKAQVDSLIGFVGASPPTPREQSVSSGAPGGGPGGTTNPGFVEVGDTLLNLAPKTTGQIWLRNNDNTNYISDVGHQIAKVIVAGEATPGS